MEESHKTVAIERDTDEKKSIEARYFVSIFWSLVCLYYLSFHRSALGPAHLIEGGGGVCYFVFVCLYIHFDVPCTLHFFLHLPSYSLGVFGSFSERFFFFFSFLFFSFFFGYLFDYLGFCVSIQFILTC